MKEVKKLLINDYKIKQLNMDFMGYALQKGDDYTFHHLMIAARDGGPYSYENGVILFTNPHEYLHVIERIDVRRFDRLTYEMFAMKAKGRLDMENIERINEMLLEFEYKHRDDYTRKGKKLIKPTYARRILTK